MNSVAEHEKREGAQGAKNHLKAWGQLLGVFVLLWLFATVVGPYFETRIPTFDKIVQTIDDAEIDSGAYFYTEIKGSYQGEHYLRNSLEWAAPDQFGLTLPFMSGIAICLLILWLGFRYMPMK